jgi:hypothetical protein
LEKRRSWKNAKVEMTATTTTIKNKDAAAAAAAASFGSFRPYVLE